MIRFFIIIVIFMSGCEWKKPLKNADLKVPPFIQEENPEIYKIFKSQPKNKK